MNYNFIYNQIIERARNRASSRREAKALLGYVERHRILPGCMGGKYILENIAYLTPEEHFTAHVLLLKMYPEHPGLIIALTRMSGAEDGKRVRRRLYGWLKRRHAEYMKQLNTGSGNSQFGTMWIHRGIENKKIKRDESIPEGWEIGRKLKNSPQILTICDICGCDTGSYSAQYCGLHRRRSRVSDEELLQALNNHKSIRQALFSVGLKGLGQHYDRVHKLLGGLTQR